MEAITVGCNKLPLQFLRRPGKLVQGSWYKIEYVALLIIAPELEFGFGFEICTLGLVPCLIEYTTLQLGRLSLYVISLYL